MTSTEGAVHNTAVCRTEFALAAIGLRGIAETAPADRPDILRALGEITESVGSVPLPRFAEIVRTCRAIDPALAAPLPGGAVDLTGLIAAGVAEIEAEVAARCPPAALARRDLLRSARAARVALHRAIERSGASGGAPYLDARSGRSLDRLARALARFGASLPASLRRSLT